ncbi:MAG: Ltp family lipoprotein, partial [Chitinophagaceae bacterium]|nr:Ltp family lipoprotein [Chitinophagaceae bacterium]
MKGEVTRKRISKIFGVATILSFVLFSLTIPPTSDETVIIDPPIVTPPVTGDIYENINTTEEKKIDTNPTPSTVEIKNISTTTQDTTSSESNVTVSQKNAVIKAKSYLGYSAFSYDGLITQLEFEQFSHADAVYGADNSGADWNEQAAKKAKAYLDYSAFSRASLIEQ